MKRAPAPEPAARPWNRQRTHHSQVLRTAMLLALLAFLAGCATLSGGDATEQILNAHSAHRLLMRDWELKALRINGRQLVIDVDTRITIRFAQGGEVEGYAAVEPYRGSYSFGADGKLSWGKTATPAARVSGPPELIERERQYLRALVQTDVAILAGHMLILQTVDATTVLTFTEAGS